MRNRPLRVVSRLAVTAAAVAAAAVVGVAVSPGDGRVVEAVGGPLGSGGEFQPLEPARIFDTRTPALDVAPLGRKLLDPLSGREPSGAVEAALFDVPVVGRGGLPAPVDENGDGQDDNVLAVVVNITVIEPTSVGWLRAFGKGAPEGTTSVANFVPGQFVPNSAILRPGRDGEISIRLFGLQPGRADIAIDVTGWFSTSTYGVSGQRVIPVKGGPVRVYDTDFAQFGGGTIVGARQQRKVQIRGAAAVDAPSKPVIPSGSNVVGVIANITGVNSYPRSAPTFVSALPTAVPSGQVPGTSTVNLLRGQVRPNLASLPLGPDGSIHLFNLAGEVRLVVDVVAYLQSGADPATRQGRVVPLVSPFRAFDTREPDFNDVPLGPAEAEDFSFERFVADVAIDGVPVGRQSALIGNLTATGLRRQFPERPALTFLTGFPTPSSGNAVPFVSNINIAEGETVPNLALLPYGARPAPAGDGRCEAKHCIRFYNRADYVDYLLDVYAVILEDG